MNEAASRLHPFSLVFGEIAAERFPAISEVLAPDAGLDAFLLAAPALELLQALRPDEGLGEAVDDFVAFVHAAWAHWVGAQRTIVLDLDATRALCQNTPPVLAVPVVAAEYIQVAPRLIWGRLADGETWEPLDGWFALPGTVGIRVVACFGLHPGRPGLSVVVAEGEAPEAAPRDDGSAPFAPLMPGGDRAGLHAVATVGELLMLARRAAPQDVDA